MLFEFSRHVFANVIHEMSDKLSVTEIGWCRGHYEDRTMNILRENHFLHFVVDGVLDFDGTLVRRGGVAYLKPMEVHDVVYPEGLEGEHYWLSFGGSGSDRLLEDTGLFSYPFSRIDDSAVDLLASVFHEAVFGAEMSEKRLSEKFEGILRYVIPFIQDKQLPETKEKRGTARTAEYAETAAEFIRYNFHTGIRPCDVAEYLGVTEKYLCKLFIAQYSMTPERFLNMCRNDKSRRLLRTTTLDIKTISALCGFDDPTYFARWFRRHNGYSATEYRAELDENSKNAAAKVGPRKTDEDG